MQRLNAYYGLCTHQVEVLKLDLSDFSSVRACAASFLANHKTLDVLMNDAGIDHNPPSLPAMTTDGFERVFQVNYLGHFLLTELLLPALRASNNSPRLINVASGAHESACGWAGASNNCLDIDQLPPPVRAPGNNTMGAPTSNYGITKFLQIYHAKELALRESQAGSPVQSFSLEPGFVDTPMALGENVFWMVPVEKAAQQIYTAIKKKKRVVYVSKRWILVAWVLKIVPTWLLKKLT